MLIALGVWFHHFQLFSAAAHKLAEVSRRCTTGGWWSRGKTLLNLQTVHVVKLSQKLSSFASLGGGRYQIYLNFESLVYFCCYFLVWNTLQVWHIRCWNFRRSIPIRVAVAGVAVVTILATAWPWARSGSMWWIDVIGGKTSEWVIVWEKLYHIYIYIVDYVWLYVYYIYSIQLTS